MLLSPRVIASSISTSIHSRMTPNPISQLATLAILVLALLFAGDACAEGVARADRNSQAAHEQLVAKARNGGISVYFLGDSITRRWGTADAAYRDLYGNWTANFHGWNAGNFGWGGDTTQNVLWRVTHGELDGVNPKVIVLLAGTNDLADPLLQSDDAKVEHVTTGIRAILDTCREKAPGAVIVLMGVLPRNDHMNLLPVIGKINRRLARFADGHTIRYLNINRKLADRHGKLHEGMVNSDGLHLAVRGYQVWADALKPVLTALLGPRAAVDTAPPPSSDPGVRAD